MEWLIGIIGLVVGAVIGAAVILLRGQSRRAAMQMDLANATARSQSLDEQARQHLAEVDRVRSELRTAEHAREAAERQAAVMNKELQTTQQHFKEQRQLLDDAKTVLRDTFRAVGGEVLESNSKQFMQQADEKLNPIKELLTKQNEAIGALETKRETAYVRLDEKIAQIATSHTELRTETGRLVTALRRPEVRGRWGEVQLRLVVEMAGMEKYCDFDEQITLWKGDQSQRPDLIVNLPGGGAIPVDAKVPLDAYEQSIQANADRETLLKRHARQVMDKVTELADRRYTELFERSPGVVVLFVSPESALIAALDVNPDLQREALARHVLLATPTTLVALLRAIAYGWQQEDVAANARQIQQVGQELYERLATFVANFESVGRGLNTAGTAYNKAIGSLESRVFPSTRKLKELHATTEPEIESPPPIEIEIRAVSSPELKEVKSLTP